MRKRTLIIVGAVVGAVVLLGFGAIVGGGVGYVLARANPQLNFVKSLTQGGPNPVLADPTAATTSGIVISDVVADGPAAAAGVARGDILLKVNDQAVNTRTDLVQALQGYAPGDQVTLTVQHGDQERALSVTLGDQNGQAYLGIAPCIGSDAAGTVRQIPVPNGTAGALIATVTSGSPAEKAGLQANDIVTAVDGQELTLNDNLAEVISSYKPGDTVTLDVTRPAAQDQQDQGEDQTLTITVTLGQNPEDATKAYLGVEYQPSLGGAFSGRIPGNGSGPFGWMPDEDQPRLPFQVVTGVAVQDVVEAGPAADAGLQVGDVITAVNGTTVTAVQDVTDILATLKPGDQVTLSVLSNGSDQAHDVVVTLGAHPADATKAYLGVQIGATVRMGRGNDNGLPNWHFGIPERPGSNDSLNNLDFQLPVAPGNATTPCAGNAL